MFTRSTILDFTGKKLALSFIAHELVDGQRPPYVHLASTRRHSRDRFSQAFPVFRALPLPCIILHENRRTKNGGGLGTRLYQLCMFSYIVLSLARKMFLFANAQEKSAICGLYMHVTLLVWE